MLYYLPRSVCYVRKEPASGSRSGLHEMNAPGSGYVATVNTKSIALP